MKPALLFLIAPIALAQTTTADSRPWSWGPLDFSALFDGYYSLNFNHPLSGANQLRNFDVEAGRMNLSMAKVTVEHSAAPLGFRLDLGYGKAFDIIHGADRAGPMRYIEQAYISWKPSPRQGFQLDFGKFASSAGAEVIETNQNWNYSRSLLFVWACPYYHFGLRAAAPIGKHFSGGVQLLNGWNNVVDNNSAKTIGLTGVFSASRLTWSNTYYAGPEKTGTNRGWRHLYDTTLQFKPGSKTSFYLNFNCGSDRKIGGGSNRWTGVAGAARVAPTRWFALSSRLEWFGDADGFATGVPQVLKEFTLTSEFTIWKSVMLRPEFRRDWSNRPFFDRGCSPAASRHQTTALAGLIAFFGAKT